jgi:hypothetical protein
MTDQNFLFIKTLQHWIKLTHYSTFFFFFSKVGDLQSSDRQYKELVGIAITLAEKLVNGKMNKQQYLENEKSNTAKREDLDSKMETLRSSLA